MLKNTTDLTNGYKTATARFKHLAQNELIPFAQILRDRRGKELDSTIINTGILTELFKYGVNKEQLPSLKALADSMGANCRQSHGKWVIEVSTKRLDEYFDPPMDQDGDNLENDGE